MTDGSRRISVEEELHLVDLRTKLPARRAAEVIAAAGDDRVRAARHGAVVATDCGGHATLEDLGAAIRERRTQLAGVANALRTGIVAAGALGSPGVELAPDPDEPGTAPGHEFRTRASARFVVTVEVADADEAQFVARRVVPHAPGAAAPPRFHRRTDDIATSGPRVRPMSRVRPHITRAPRAPQPNHRRTRPVAGGR